MKKIAVVLSGCGVFDGSEIHEAVLTLLALARAGAESICIAPNLDQKQVIDHNTGEIAEDEYRNVMEEAARISRGKITQMSMLDIDSIDAVIFIGGYGVAKNLSSLAFDGPSYDVDPIVCDLIRKANNMGKALGFMCIAPALAAVALGNLGIKLTIGNDKNTATALTGKGATHIECPVDEIVVDKTHKIVTTPAYMLAQNILEAEAGINKLVNEVLKLS